MWNFYDASAFSPCYNIQILVLAQQMTNSDSLLNLILRQAEAIKFAFDWKKIGQQRGGKKYKGDFARSVYESRTGQRPPDTNRSTKEEKTAFKLFKIRQQSLITSRNYLLDLYNEVSSSVALFSRITSPFNILLNSSVFPCYWILCGVQTNSEDAQKLSALSLPSFETLDHHNF